MSTFCSFGSPCGRSVIQSVPFFVGSPCDWEKSGREGGIMWVCMSILKGDFVLWMPFVLFVFVEQVQQL